MPPRAERASSAPPERRALQDTLAWPIALALLSGAAVVFFLPRVVPTRFLALAIGGVFACVTVVLVLVLALLIERWLRRHAATIALDAERQVQTLGIAGLPTATGDGALIPLASAYADAGARAALVTAERETSDLLSKLGSDVAVALSRVGAQLHHDPDSARQELDDMATALRRVAAPVPVAVTPVDLVALVREATEDLPEGSVRVILDTDHALVSVDRARINEHVRDLLALAHAASPQDVPVTVHVSRIFRSNIEETPVRRTGDSRLTIVPRSSGDALRAWVSRAQPGAEVLSLIITDSGRAPSPDEQQRAFDAFAVERPGDPLGVTLSTVRRTVAAARGTMWIDGSREGGTAVHLLLPIATS
ncbi:MAG: ATP-binding protein [Gemmatimonadota bacterium]